MSFRGQEQNEIFGNVLKKNSADNGQAIVPNGSFKL